jgi:stage II sporulation protein D
MSRGFRIVIVFMALNLFNFILNLPANAIRIGLYTNTNDYVYLGVSKEGMIVDARTNENIMILEGMKPYRLNKNGSYITIFINGKEYNIDSNYFIIRPNHEKAFVFTKNKWYRGQLVVFNTTEGLIVANDVELENYIMGVVPAEMPSRWNPEAQKAQAIAARSYAVANAGKRGRYGYDLKDTPEDQAYSGASGETLQTNQAVIDTKGLVLVCNDKVIPAYYHASSGGRTVESGEVWGKNLPFLKSVQSYDGNLPKKGHGVGMSQNGANVLANYGYNAYQILGYFYQNVELKRLY